MDLFDSPEAGPLPPANGLWRHGQREVRPAFEEGLQRALTLNSGELVAQTEMDPRAELQVAVGLPLEIKLLRTRVCIRIHVGSRQHGHDFFTLLQPNSTELDIFPDETRLGELDGRDEAQEFLNCQIGAAPILLEPIAQGGSSGELVDRSADQMCGGF